MEEDRLRYFSSKLDFKYLFSDAYPDMILDVSNISGKGVVTKEKIKKGKIICPLFGVLYNIHKAKIHYPKYSYQISDEIAIETVNEPGFFNHSCEPNVYINEDWMFEALQEIKTGEEVVIDYGTVDYFDYGFECLCGADSCRKDFNGMVSGNANYQKEKGKYFSPYLKAKFQL